MLNSIKEINIYTVRYFYEIGSISYKKFIKNFGEQISIIKDIFDEMMLK
jgi:hypothetical protein